MKTMYLDISIPRIVLTRVLGRVWPGAYFASTSPLHLAELPEPPLPGPEWVRVRNRMCGICGSDLHQLFVDASLDVAPVALPAHKRIYLGHEMIGEVTEVGAAATPFRVGDRVVRWGRADDCRARGRTTLCPACTRGHRVLCEFASEARDAHPVGGGFGDSFITPASTLVPVPDEVTDEQAIFTEPIAVAIHAAYRKIAAAHDKVLVLGCGPIGFLLIQTIRLLRPACHLTAVAEFPWQAELARQLGADETFLAHEDGYKATCELTGARMYEGRGRNRMLLGGFDLIFDVVGIPATLHNALRWTRAGGTVILVGVYLHKMVVDLTPVWHQEVNLIGAVGHDVVTYPSEGLTDEPSAPTKPSEGFKMRKGESISTFDLALRWLAEGKIQTAPLLTHRFPLSDYRHAFHTAIAKAQTRAIKVAFTMGG